MRLLAATLRNYRLHRELTVAFDPARTLIGGPNESGKSTLVEALHRALFLRARGTGEPHQLMRSFGGGQPEVDLEFESGGRRYHLHKRFSGQTGTTSLTASGAAPLSGEAAESELARLFGVGEDANAKSACNRWAHLWVWQGASAGDPAEHANAQRDSLIQRLSQAGGAAAAMQSAEDARVAAGFAKSVEEIFTAGEKARAGSELARAEEAHASALRVHTEALARLERLDQARREHTEATQTLAALQVDLARHRQEHDATEARAARLTELRQIETAQRNAAMTAETAFASLQRTEEQIIGLRRKTTAHETALAPQAATVARLTAAAARARAEASERIKRCDGAADAVRFARQQHELAAAYVAGFEKRQRAAELEARAMQARQVAATLATLTSKLAQLPAIEPNQFKRLEKLETARSAAETTLQGTAAGIEVLASDQPIQLSGRTLTPGQIEIITDDTELTIGSSIRLRVRPGGGTTLAEARGAAQDARAHVQKLLDTLGIPSVAAAAEIARHRAEVAGQIKIESTRLADLDTATVEPKLQSAQAEVLAADAEIGRRLSALPAGATPPVVADAVIARDAVKTTIEQLRDAESTERRTRTERDATAEALAAAEAALATQVAAVERQTRELGDLQAQLRLLLENHGADSDRAARMARAQAGKVAADLALAGTRDAIAREQPDLLAPTQARLARMREGIQERQQRAENAKAIAETLLRSDGSLDPEADLALARAALASAADRLASVRRHAEAFRLLDTLFRAEQQNLAEQFTRPLVNVVSVYLQAMFGPGARASVTLEDNTFSQLCISRPGMAGDAGIEFAKLSGGTKEQVAVAVRLALAEILAADHDGCLPLVLDDAFTNADAERVQQLQRMLDLAASRGLQVIVVTCHPSDYAGLGARTIMLQPPRSARETGEREAKVEHALARVVVDAAMNEAQRTQFLNTLREQGGSAGNVALQLALGWDDATYDEVKASLVAAGVLARGKGRGGSVALKLPAAD